MSLATSKEEQNIKDAQANPGVFQFVSSKMFANIFAEGMELVEETAGYLDGEGRDLSKEFERSQALSYAALSMKLTTKLMQIASWLLVLRAVREDEMSYGEAALEKYRISKPERTQASRKAGSNEKFEMPHRLLELRDETDLLHERVARIDNEIFILGAEFKESTDAMGQLKALQAAFE